MRLSGPEAEPIARRLFRPRRPLTQFRSHRLYLGHAVDATGQVIDEVLFSLMRGPNSYTKEDVVEINCHSGHLVLRRILTAALALGARLARPGEFTLRAFLSGRLDLTQAEAVLEVIRARTTAALQVAESHLAGELGRRFQDIREALLMLLARVEAALDFPEEAGELPVAEVSAALARQAGDLDGLLATYREGRLLKEGLLTVIAGRPNVGKSSLLNRLLKEERAIVTEIPGTTRDLIEEVIAIQGLPVRLTDTAGLRGEAGDRVEELGMARTRERLAQADLVLYLVDGSEPLDPEDARALADLAGRPALAVVNKMDLPPRLSKAELTAACPLPVRKISALTGEGLEELKGAIVELALGGGVSAGGGIITQVRHQQHLQACQACLARARELLRPEPPWELVALELREAVRELGELTGEEVGEDVLDRIFAQFCLGK